LGDFQENPVAALGKGWSIFSAAVLGATKAVNENIIQPGIERATDPNLVQSVRGYAISLLWPCIFSPAFSLSYASEAGKQASALGESANNWGKRTWGVDVAGQTTDLVGTARRAAFGNSNEGYSTVGHEEETSALYRDDDDDFFNKHTDTAGGPSQTSSAPAPTAASASSYGATTAAPAKKKQDEWEDW
jgi:ADP-ribosylation factor GTPase-activating protein 1